MEYVMNNCFLCFLLLYIALNLAVERIQRALTVINGSVDQRELQTINGMIGL